MRQKIIVISTLVIAVGILWGFYYVDHLFDTPSEEELPNEVLIMNAEKLEEVKIFLQKYPNAQIQIERSGRLAVDYRVSKPSNDNNSLVDPYLRLRIFLNLEGKPEEIFIDCWNGQNNNIERVNIINYLKIETCLGLGA